MDRINATATAVQLHEISQPQPHINVLFTTATASVAKTAQLRL